jgi:hypothetical protein
MTAIGKQWLLQPAENFISNFFWGWGWGWEGGEDG